MSILVAMIGRNASLIATDQRRIESDGSFRDDYPKAFQTKFEGVIGGSVGLLEFSGRTVEEWINSLPHQSFETVEILAQETATLIERELLEVDPSEVGFAHRRLDVVLLGKSPTAENPKATEIRTIGFSPDANSQTIRVECNRFPQWCVAGDDAATDAIKLKLSPLNVGALPKNKLKGLAELLIHTGTRKAGRSMGNPAVLSCGGRPWVTVL